MRKSLPVKREQSKPAVTCPRCNGCGQVILSDEYWAVLSKLRAVGHATAPQLHLALKTKSVVGAVNNSLEYLRSVGLAIRKRRGRGWQYSATTYNP